MAVEQDQPSALSVDVGDADGFHDRTTTVREPLAATPTPNTREPRRSGVPGRTDGADDEIRTRDLHLGKVAL